MEQHETDLLRDVMQAHRDEMLAITGGLAKDISDIKADLHVLTTEYETVLIEQRAGTLATKKLRNVIIVLASISTAVGALAPIVLHLLHLG